MAVLHSASWLLPVLGEPIADGALLESDGVIIAVGPRADLVGADHDREQHYDGVIIPGLVNAHTHLQYSLMADLGRQHYTGFPAWARSFQAEFTAPGNDWYASARDGARQALAAGSTAVADVVTSVEAFGALHDSGLKGIAYWEVMAWPNGRWMQTGRAATERLLKEHAQFPVGISPHAPYSLDEEVLADLTRLSCELGLRRHIHLAESLSEVEFITSGTGPQAATLRRWGLEEFALLQRGGSGVRPVRYVDGLAGLGPECHIAHGVYVDADDRAVLRRHNTVVALCPRSNAVIGLDEAPVADYLREGNLLAVGTDSLASSPSLDVLADAAALAAIARRQGYTDDDLHTRLLEAATLGGARAMGLDRALVPVGALAAGYAPDFAVLDLTPGSAAEAAVTVVEAGTGTVMATVINGQLRTPDSDRR